MGNESDEERERRTLLEEISGVIPFEPAAEEPQPPPPAAPAEIPIVVAIPPRPRPKPRTTHLDELSMVVAGFAGILWFAAGAATSSWFAVIAGAGFSGAAVATGAFRVWRRL